MPTFRENPYGAFNYIVNLGGDTGDGTNVVGGFSDVSGLGFEVNYSDYRNGNERVNTVRHVPNTFKNDEVTLKRGADTRLQCDGQPQLDLLEGDRITVRRSPHALQLVHPPGYDYYAMLREKLHWSETPL